MFAPDKISRLVHMHHQLAPVLVPSSILSLWLYGNDSKYWTYFGGIANVLFFGHSYYACSCVITDYLSFPKIEYGMRFINLKLHLIGMIGNMYLIKQLKKD